MVNCPMCGRDNKIPKSEWNRGTDRRKMTIRTFKCSSCGGSYAAWKDSNTGKLKVVARGYSK